MTTQTHPGLSEAHPGSAAVTPRRARRWPRLCALRLCVTVVGIERDMVRRAALASSGRSR
ncbi:hypothetical protein ACFWF3_30610 [Nocardia sp. NPDC060220]|uniref:hypothetical protein n=1 Tax=Nocardia sp. NPDC060220 TaxID=3347076 RepID=UPI003649E61C